MKNLIFTTMAYATIFGSGIVSICKNHPHDDSYKDHYDPVTSGHLFIIHRSKLQLI